MNSSAKASFVDWCPDCQGDDGGQLGQVQGVGLLVEQDGARQDAGGADAAHHQVLEGGLQGAGDPVAEGGEGHGGEGQDLHHDEHVEEVAGEDQAHDAAGQHQEQGVILGLVVILAHVLRRSRGRRRTPPWRSAGRRTGPGRPPPGRCRWHSRRRGPGCPSSRR